MDEIDGDLHSFLEFWSSKQKEIYVQTSGSTGKPKKIKISKEQMIESANATIMHFNLKKKMYYSLLFTLKIYWWKNDDSKSFNFESKYTSN